MKYLLIIIQISFLLETKSQTTTVKSNGTLYSRPHVVLSKPLDQIQAGSSIMLLAIGKHFYEANYNGQRGYVFKWNVKEVPVTSTFNEDKIALQPIDDEIAKSHGKASALDELVSKGYSKQKAQDLLNGVIWIGMTANELKISQGEPQDINRTITKYGTDEQWIYGDRYVYLENGIVTTIQD